MSSQQATLGTTRPSAPTGVVIDMGDLEFIQGKVIAGAYFQVSGDIDGINDTIEFIVPNGKTAFMISAKIIISDHPAASTRTTGGSNTQKDIVSAALKIDGTTKDETTIGEATAAGIASSNQNGGGTGSGYGNLGDGRFNVLGLSLVGDGIKVIEIENTLDDGSAFATMSGYLSTTT